MTSSLPNGILMSAFFLGIFLAQVSVWDLEKQSCSVGATYISEVRVVAEVMAGPVPISAAQFSTMAYK